MKTHLSITVRAKQKSQANSYQESSHKVADHPTVTVQVPYREAYIIAQMNTFVSKKKKEEEEYE